MNMLSKVTPWPWIIEDRSVVTADGCICIATTDNGEYRAPDDEPEANRDLIALAPDHALLLAAICDEQASITPYQIRGVRRFDIVATGKNHTCEIDPFGAPILTPELRAELKKALGLGGVE